MAKKEKITYIDDGRTIADMSGISGGVPRNRDYRPRASLKEQWQTYWNAVKMMLLPMLVVVGAIILIYIVITVLFTLL